MLAILYSSFCHPLLTADTNSRAPKTSVPTAAAAAASQVSPEQAKVICGYNFYFYFGSECRKIGLGNECLMVFRLTIF